MVLVEDECRVQKESSLTSIWFKRGKYPKIKIEQQKQAVSFYGVLDTKTGKETVLKTERQNSKNTVLLLERLEKKYQGKDALLIWDGASWHRGEVKKYLKRKGKKWKLKIMYLPPYSPDFNPQEHVWKRAKQKTIHNSEEEFEVKVNNFNNFLKRTKFKTNFLQKYL